MERSLEAERWNADYEQRRKYEGDPPIAFVQTILDELGEDKERLFGLYPGCGNGRNYIPLLEQGLKLHGTDISQVALDQILARCPDAKNRLALYDFAQATAANVFDYIISIQVFQHGNRQKTAQYFKNSHIALKQGGRLFLRVNSINTQIEHPHHQVETSPEGGFSIVYNDGPKKDMVIRFYSAAELAQIAETLGFNISTPAYEVIETRPNKTTWSQWETIWQKS